MPAPTDDTKILDERFALSFERREGGMAWVQKAMDLQTGEYCAIKRMLLQHDELLAKESFHRELEALQALRHSNIVTMIAYGIDPQRRPYLALEWADETLDEVVRARSRSMQWSEFWPTVGRPILDAIAVAQGKGYIHRDIKPTNVLIASGIPKISDYGISRLGAYSQNPMPGRPTFRDFSSKPYSPPESDGDIAPYARDGFSWTVLAIFCLTKTEPPDYGAIPATIDALPDAPTEILKRAASVVPADRPQNAALLLQEIDAWQEAHASSKVRAICCYLSFDNAINRHLANILGPAESDPSTALLTDFSDTVAVRSVQDEANKLRIVGATWELLVSHDVSRPGKLIVERARLIGGRAAERRREGAWGGDLRLVIGEPPDPDVAEDEIAELFMEVAAADNERAIAFARDTDRIFRTWFAYLQAREDLEKRQGSGLKYSDRQVNGRQVTLVVTDPISPEIVGEERMIRVGFKYVLLEVLSVIADEATCDVMMGDASLIPKKGVLETSTIREEIAIERQRQALNAIVYGRSVNSQLRDILISPRTVRPPLPNIHISDPGADFDADKKAILAQALGIQDVLAVEGPPGTGKTRLIEEIIVQYLERNPSHRVLLSSQTHVALDNVIERVRDRSRSLDIVRVGRFNDPKIASLAIELLLERKAQAWSACVSAKARQWLESWARGHGVDPSDLRAGIAALSLSHLLIDKAQTREHLEEAETRGASIAAQAADRFISTASRGVNERRGEQEATLDTASFRTRLEAISADETALRKQLASFDGYKRELAESQDPHELAEYAAMLFGDTEAHTKCLDLMRMQESWLERVGKSTDFHAAMLASANVVAATCVGLAAVRGMNEVPFDLCIVDEASKATATEVLVPLSRSRRSILVGDPKQLPPFFERQLLEGHAVAEFSESELRLNVFDLLLASLPTTSKARLRHQHRMARPIGDLISQVFYSGELVSPKEKPKATFPSFPKLVTWLDTSRIEDRSEQPVGTSFQNPAECRVIRHVVETLAFTASKRRGAVYDVAIITGYQAQVKAIENSIRDQRITWGGLQVRVNTVDAFQGCEADVCIYSVVRSNDRGEIGFLREPPRLNVALSRARDLLIIIGDHDFCATSTSIEPMAEVVRYIATNPIDCEVRPANDS
jgi:serine/threonine protein kinase